MMTHRSTRTFQRPLEVAGVADALLGKLSDRGAVGVVHTGQEVRFGELRMATPGSVPLVLKNGVFSLAAIPTSNSMTYGASATVRYSPWLIVRLAGLFLLALVFATVRSPWFLTVVPIAGLLLAFGARMELTLSLERLCFEVERAATQKVWRDV